MVVKDKVELAQRGERDPDRLRDRVITEAVVRGSLK
jgi:hypothetical protein